MIQFWHFFFAPSSGAWFTGNVWGNMVAWVICGALAGVWATRKFIKWDNKRKKEDVIRHEELKTHILKIHKHLGIKGE